ncbi:hydroxyisourate hydrolase [Azospirillum halopraeferens]|uniref:hydroxyisourate hydrolase n=1 Tax=Azospirillum halopraeferens TaxID=34010 RepID=UPI0004051256|nr:hydroxyisourate hydrolase [Azospirillum halopraeferens]
MGRLTTHVLDTAHGRPAAGMIIALQTLAEDGAFRLLKQVETNADGRTGEPLLDGDALLAGTYQLVFMAGDYFRRIGVDLPDPPFLDHVPVRFGIADRTAHYHVPLLVSPYGFSTYRGS